MDAKREEPRVGKLRAMEVTLESFAPFGRVMAASPDGDQFGPHDAQLDLSRGIPRSGHGRPLKILQESVPGNHPQLLFWVRSKIVTFFLPWPIIFPVSFHDP
jgi:hypothetical protein